MTTLQRIHTSVVASSPALVFVHGLGGHPIDTWRHRDRHAHDFWPLWVGEDTDSRICFALSRLV